MAIPNVDEYLKKTISTQMTVLLENPYIIKEAVLSDIDSVVRQSFIDTYCGKNPKQEIPVSFTYNPEHSNFGQILIQYKGAEEDEGSLGGLVGSMNDIEGNTRQEDVVWKTVNRQSDEGYSEIVLMVETEEPIERLLSFKNVSLKGANVHVEDKYVYIPYQKSLDSLDNVEDKITYIPSREDDVIPRDGVLRGYDLTESYTIDTISSNIDMLRCIDNLLKTILITMRQNVNEQTEYRLAQLNFSGLDLLDPINSPTDSARGNQIFYRRAEVVYGVTYSINTTYGTKVEKLLQTLYTGGELVSDGNKKEN